MIQARILKGFRDILPAQELRRLNLQNTLQNVFHSFGFAPIDTPVLEYSDILLAKNSGDTAKEMYRFLDHGKRDVGLRFDLTVPLARFVSQYKNDLALPFKRYQMGKVWRGEKPQKGRFREFMQCDFDIVGSNTLSTSIEILLIIQKSIQTLGFDNFKIHYSHRNILRQLLKKLSFQEDNQEEILRIIDKLPKIGIEKTQESLNQLEKHETGENLLHFLELINHLPTLNQERKEFLLKKFSLNDSQNSIILLQEFLGNSEALEELQELEHTFIYLGLEQYFHFDFSITRGLDYYTGLVFETFITGHENLGSVSSGGRYDNLISHYSKENLSGIGASIGFDRLLTLIEDQNEKIADVLIICLEEDLVKDYHKIAHAIRQQGFKVDIYPHKKKIPVQIKYAQSKNIDYAIFMGKRELENQELTLKNLKDSQSFENINLEKVFTLLNSFKV